ncbi:MAG: TRAP transporter small permease [Alphaproteobacteria bacterium]|nr:TRAP transporter small permease [Alphaproteobacteria bacterium]
MSEPNKVSNRALDITDGAVGVFGYVGGVAAVSLVVMTCVGVYYRYMLNNPLNGLGDIIGLVLSFSIACSLCYGARRGAHVAVDVLNMVGGRVVTRWTDIIVRVLGIAIICVACYALWINGQCGILCAYTTSSLSIPLEWSYYAMAVGMAAYGIVLVVELIVGLANFWQPVDPSEKST